MSRKLAPPSIWSFPSFRLPFSVTEEKEEEAWGGDFSDLSGLSVSEDETCVYIEAALPGIKPEEVEVTFENGIVWIKAEKKEENEIKTRKFYRRATCSFSYHVAVPGNVDEHIQPDAIIKYGMIQITFAKTTDRAPKKIAVKHA
jgi:HSP20 family protein